MRFVLFVISAFLCVGSGFARATQNSDSSSSGVVFCYYGAWANERPGVGRYGVDDIPLNLCTHILYSFLGLTETGDLTPLDENIIGNKSNLVKDFIGLKDSNPDLKLLIAVGGWNEGSTNFSIVVNNDNLRANFVNNLVTFLDDNGFDGLDVDWEYPGQRGGLETDKEQFVVLLKELKEKFEPKGYILTAAVAVTQSHIDLSYDVPNLNIYLDYISLMTYDFHGTWYDVTGVNAPLYPQLTDDADSYLNVNSSVHVWIANGASPSKLVLGLGSYGKTFTLVDLNNTSTGAPFSGAGAGGPYTYEDGNYAYYEICIDQLNNTDSWSITEVAGNYVYANKDLFWVGYDNTNTIYAKAQYAKTMGLAGIMYWAVDMDDFVPLCGDKQYPLISEGIAGYNSI